MSENRGKQEKRSFVIYTDSLDVLDNMSDEECGQLFRAIKAFQNSRQDELKKLLDNPFIKGIFLNFQAYFTRDSEKYENICKKRKDAALKSSEKKKQMVANASNCKQLQANGSKCPLDTDTDTDTDTDNDNDNEKGVWGKNARAYAREETHPTGQETGKFKSCLFFCTFFTTKKKTLLTKKHLKPCNTRYYLLILVNSVNCC